MARRERCDLAVCGHTHHAEQAGDYTNVGCWTEDASHYAVVRDGVVELVAS